MKTKVFECIDYKFHTVHKQPQHFVEKLSASERARFYAASESLAACFADGCPPFRSRLVKGAKLHNLFALPVDWPVGSGAGLTLLALRDGKDILLARGLRGNDGRIPSAETARAERALAAYLGGKGERKGGKAR